jgi:hypothetical protein
MIKSVQIHSKKNSPLKRVTRSASQILHRFFIPAILIALTLLNSCKKQEIGPQCPACQDEVVPTTTDVLIGCEGNFGWGNASLSSYNPITKNVSNQVFQNVNGFGLGDVLQDITEINGTLYITMNNSSKIVMVDTSDYSFKGEITGFNSPRYITSKNDKAYVSDLYSNSIQIVDLVSKTITGNIVTQRWVEHLVIHQDYLYVTAPDTNWVFKINTLNDMIEDTIIVGKSPSGIAKDKNEKIWVLSSGGTNGELATLKKYNPFTSQIEQNIVFNSLTASPGNLRMDDAKENLYFLNEGLQSISIDDVAITSAKQIPTNGSVFYGMNVDPNNKDIYITDAVDYVQQGKVYRYDSIYQPIDTFVVGIIPQSIWFK